MSNYFTNYRQEYDDYLEHHGIKGQKWGIRRFQNPDGTLTAAGKKRYLNSDFAKAEREVKKRCSNICHPFIKESISISQVKERSGLNTKDAMNVIRLANNKFREAAFIEPQITKDIINIVSNNGGVMYGLEHRLKQPSSLAGKIGADSKEDNISFVKASNNIKDSIRYTIISDVNNFVHNYQRTKDKLKSLGYEEIKCKNYFEKYKRGEAMHKSVQCVYKTSKGYPFEIQFQTPASQAAKELKLPIYEERRKIGISEERASELEAKMRYLADQVMNPPNIDKIH